MGAGDEEEAIVIRCVMMEALLVLGVHCSVVYFEIRHVQLSDIRMS